MDEGAYFIGQGCYTQEVLERFNSSMHYKHRNTPRGPESLSNNKRQEEIGSKKIQYLIRAW
eukprot:6835598-Prorocentrum_lima.AAC.1